MVFRGLRTALHIVTKQKRLMIKVMYAEGSEG